MRSWHCYDRCSGERFKVRSDEGEVLAAVETYIRNGIDADTGAVDYDVVATAADGSAEHHFDGTVSPDAD